MLYAEAKAVVEQIGLHAEAKAVVEQIGLRVAPVILADRAAFHHSTGGGKAAQEIAPNSKAAEEISKLWEWLWCQVNLSARNRVNTLARARA
jgi:chromosome partitioning protein